ncbi:hypothetical protein A6F68_00273 [Tsuneonella dongtanensis]|uniref:Bacteriophage phiJL001 Gp84 C-terminal domain-containing protein n=1 Tax=Tsuneonella dongtanensis TaxID=692370 RepID=A0A1B2A9R0_9SPHN|nr:DUF2163 domain-containing protein [Tsuneonella dongtanensis]ANY18808.1 hypothetical protein A6F68_00273 [Tsuneonella dongtanensis]
MSHVFFATELEGVATFWRIHRKDGVTLGFTSHDRDLVFGGVRHRAAPGLLPSAIRRTAGLDGDSAEMQGALAHDSISSADLAQGRFDGARVEVGAVDWETLQHAVLYNGSIGEVAQEGAGFTAELRSAKAALEADPIPRTSPTCRAEFCGPDCGLSAARFTHRGVVVSSDSDEGVVSFDHPDPAAVLHGTVRWLDGPDAGLTADIVALDAAGIVIDAALDPPPSAGVRAILREGCDHTIATCADRFGNAANFRGEPFLPGNDLLSRYPSPA